VTDPAADPDRLLAEAEVLLVRHGAFERADPDGRLVERVAGTDLSRLERLAARLAAGGRDLVVLSGPKERAVASARPLADGLGRTLYVDPDLDELRLGRHPDLDAEATARIWRDARAHPDAPAIPGAETLDALGRRALATLRAAVRAHPGHGVVAVTHGGLIEAVVRACSDDAALRGRAGSIGHGTVTGLDPAEDRVLAVGVALD
jgi:probable phosphoglycerate mutase